MCMKFSHTFYMLYNMYLKDITAFISVMECIYNISGTVNSYLNCKLYLKTNHHDKNCSDLGLIKIWHEYTKKINKCLLSCSCLVVIFDCKQEVFCHDLTQYTISFSTYMLRENTFACFKHCFACPIRRCTTHSLPYCFIC